MSSFENYTTNVVPFVALHRAAAAAVALGEVNDHDKFPARHADAHGRIVRRQIRMRRQPGPGIHFVNRRAARQMEEIEAERGAKHRSTHRDHTFAQKVTPVRTRATAARTRTAAGSVIFLLQFRSFKIDLH